MEIEKLIEPAPDWTGQTWAARMDAAGSQLFLHGYITQRAREKITSKLEHQFQLGIDSGRIIAKEQSDAI